MKIETKEKIEIFKQVIQGLFKLLVGVSILFLSIGFYNHFKNPKVEDKPKEPLVSESDCEKYVKEVIELFGEGHIIKKDNFCNSLLLGLPIKEFVDAAKETEKIKEEEKKKEEAKKKEEEKEVNLP